MGQRFKELIEWLCVTPFQQQNMVLNCLFAPFLNVLLFPTKKNLTNLFSKYENGNNVSNSWNQFQIHMKADSEGQTSQKKNPIWLFRTEVVENLIMKLSSTFKFEQQENWEI